MSLSERQKQNSKNSSDRWKQLKKPVEYHTLAEEIQEEGESKAPHILLADLLISFGNFLRTC